MRGIAIAMVLCCACRTGQSVEPRPGEPGSPYGRTPDNRLIVYGDAPLWCMRDDFGFGSCEATESECVTFRATFTAQHPKVVVGQCTQLWAAACSYQADVITGRPMQVCFPGIPQCDNWALGSVQSGRRTGSTRCAVYRLRGYSPY